MKEQKQDTIRRAVRESYASVATAGAARHLKPSQESCCGGTTADTAALVLGYGEEEVRAVPEGANMGLGCGNPTAIGELLPGETVIDFGSGGGIDCFLASRAVGPEGMVIGVDMTQDMIDLARSNAEKLGVSNAEFHLTEMESTPLPDETADVIISNCVINLSPDKDAVFKEAFRLLKPGGRIYISDMLLVKDLPQEAKEDMKNWVSCLGGAEPKDVYLGRMTDSGFRDIEIMADVPYGDGETWASYAHSMNIKAAKPA